MMNIVIYGAGGHGSVVLDAIHSSLSGPAVLGFIDDDSTVSCGDLAFFGGREFLPKVIEMPAQVVVAITDNRIRREIVEYISGRFPDLVTGVRHSRAYVSSRASVGDGCMIVTDAIVHPRAFVGANTVINTRAVIEHDVTVGAYSHIAPGAILLGACEVGEGTDIFAGAIVLPKIKVGNRCTVGAGAIVMNDVPDGTTVVGNPAHVPAR
jgi:sugar O-acyltransferase (sialic acid O-acetyltransferase NeuD family)